MTQGSSSDTKAKLFQTPFQNLPVKVVGDNNATEVVGDNNATEAAEPKRRRPTYNK